MEPNLLLILDSRSLDTIEGVDKGLLVRGSCSPVDWLEIEAVGGGRLHEVFVLVRDLRDCFGPLSGEEAAGLAVVLVEGGDDGQVELGVLVLELWGLEGEGGLLLLDGRGLDEGGQIGVAEAVGRLVLELELGGGGLVVGLQQRLLQLLHPLLQVALPRSAVRR